MNDDGNGNGNYEKKMEFVDHEILTKLMLASLTDMEKRVSKLSVV